MCHSTPTYSGSATTAEVQIQRTCKSYPMIKRYDCIEDYSERSASGCIAKTSRADISESAPEKFHFCSGTRASSPERSVYFDSQRGSAASISGEDYGAATSSVNPGIVRPILAFRGEIEAQVRGSLHSHILVWLVCMSAYVVAQILQRDPEKFQLRLRGWMRAMIAPMERVTQSSSQNLPHQFGDPEKCVSPPALTKVERSLSRYDGGSEVDVFRADGESCTVGQRASLETADPDEWKRPLLPLRRRDGRELEDGEELTKPPSVYTRPIDTFAVTQCPEVRRTGPLRKETNSEADEETASQTCFTEWLDADASQ